jgi:uncharacterized membrane protein
MFSRPHCELDAKRDVVSAEQKKLRERDIRIAFFKRRDDAVPADTATGGPTGRPDDAGHDGQFGDITRQHSHRKDPCMFNDPDSLLNVLFRWSHILFGIIWLGHLYFFNLVNVPFQGDLEKELKPKVNPKLLLRAFYWFRWGAMYTFLIGLLLFGFKYFHQGLFFEHGGGISNRALWILFGATIGTIMWFNVWFVIWPRQKLILGGLAAGTPHPDAAKLAATAGKASRFNTYASGPMLFGMVVPNNYAGWPAVGMLLALVLGIGFWFGMIKRSFKIKTTV